MLTLLDDGVSLLTFIFCYCCVHVVSAKSVLLVGVLPVGNQGCFSLRNHTSFSWGGVSDGVCFAHTVANMKSRVPKKGASYS